LKVVKLINTIHSAKLPC